MKNHSIFRLKALGFEPEDMTIQSVRAEKVHQRGCREHRNGRGTKSSLGNACWLWGSLGFTRAVWKSVGSVAKE